MFLKQGVVPRGSGCRLRCRQRQCRQGDSFWPLRFQPRGLKAFNMEPRPVDACADKHESFPLPNKVRQNYSRVGVDGFLRVFLYLKLQCVAESAQDIFSGCGFALGVAMTSLGSTIAVNWDKIYTCTEIMFRKSVNDNCFRSRFGNHIPFHGHKNIFLHRWQATTKNVCPNLVVFRIFWKNSGHKSRFAPVLEGDC